MNHETVRLIIEKHTDDLNRLKSQHRRGILDVKEYDKREIDLIVKTREQLGMGPLRNWRGRSLG